MSTANFEPMNFDMPLIVGGMGNDFEERKKAWEAENDGEYTEDTYYSELDWEVEDLNEEVKEWNKELSFFSIEIKSGYYQGWQWQINWEDPYLDYEQIMSDEDFDEDDSDYFYGDTVKNVREQVEKEKKMCEDYLLSLKDRGYLNLYKYAQFSNGEAIYKEVGKE